jgi:uncharacterized membrane protein
MVSVRVSTEVAAPRQRVWDELARIEDHVTWMLDATAIRFQGDQRTGIGTTFACDTRFGPIRLTDTMEVTEWEPQKRIGVRHRGAVSGTGSFVLSDAPGSTTRIEWEEDLVFPWWLGAGMGALVAKPLFVTVWKGNLRRLGRRVLKAQQQRKGGTP